MTVPLEGLRALLQSAAVALVVTAVGRRLLTRAIPDSTEFERRVLGAAVGMALLSILSTACLFAGISLRWAVPILLGTGALLCGRDVSSLAIDALRWIVALRTLRGWESVSRTVLLLYGFLGVIGCLAPETGWDAGVYHFTMPRLWVEEGRLTLRPDIPLGSMPAAMEALYATGFSLQGEAQASLMNFMFYMIGYAFARGWAERIGGPNARIIAGFGYLSLTTYVLRMGGGDVEVGQAVYLALLLYALSRRLEGGGTGWRLIGGIAAGMMLSIKYSSAWALAAVAAGWMVAGRRTLRERLVDGVVLVVVGLAVASPWYVRNELVFGDPVFPVLVKNLGGRHEYSVAWSDLGAAILKGFRFDSFVLVSIALLVLPGLRAGWVLPSLVLYFVFLLIHLMASHLSLINIVRFWSPAFLPLLVFGSARMGVPASRPGVVRAAAILMALAVCVTSGIHALRNGPKVPVAAGFKSRDSFLEERINSYWAIREAERNLSPGSRILLIEQRAYYCLAPFLTASDIQNFVRFEEIATGGRLRVFLEREGIEWVVYNSSETARTSGFRDLLARSPGILSEAGVHVMGTRNECTLYRVARVGALEEHPR